MPVTLVCPNCSEINTHHELPVDRCSRCQTAYPDQLRAKGDAALRRTDASKPALLHVGMWGSLASGAFILSFMLVLAPLDLGSYTINDVQVTGPEFLRRVGAPFIVGVIVGGAMLLTTGIGLWLNRPWTRQLMVGFWVVVNGSLLVVAIVSPSTGSDLLGAFLTTGVTLVPAVFYLYFNKSAAAYYRALESAEVRHETLSGGT